jgi:pimeloyl-ACP methyl ester carboxylesterase
VAQFPTAGGAQRFLQFMREELFPYIETHYRTAGFRLLIGHSFGGLFAVEALETHPEMFQAYVVISPSLWWNDQELIRQAPEDLHRHEDLKARIYMATGDEGERMLDGARGLTAVFDSTRLAGLRWHFQFMPTEDHGSNPHRTTYDGLEWIFGDFHLKEPEQTALFAAGITALDRHFAELSASYGYPIATPEALINRLGYRYLQDAKGDLAIGAFLENVRRFPRSANTYDSLGDGYAQIGRLKDAAASYRQAVEIGQATGDPVVPFSQGKLADTERRLAAGSP